MGAGAKPRNRVDGRIRPFHGDSDGSEYIFTSTVEYGGVSFHEVAEIYLVNNSHLDVSRAC